MAKLHRRNNKAKTETIEAVVESTPAPVEATPVTQEIPNGTKEIPNESPVVVTPPAESKPKAKRYAPVSILANPKSVVTYVAPQYHKQGSLTYDKFAIIIEAGVGATIADVEQAFDKAGKTRQKARNQMRWEFEHGKINIEPPVEQPKVEG